MDFDPMNKKFWIFSFIFGRFFFPENQSHFLKGGNIKYCMVAIIFLIFFGAWRWYREKNLKDLVRSALKMFWVYGFPTRSGEKKKLDRKQLWKKLGKRKGEVRSSTGKFFHLVWKGLDAKGRGKQNRQIFWKSWGRGTSFVLLK